jgi:hypothetical protein
MSVTDSRPELLQGMKFDTGKAPLWIVPWEALEPMIPEPARRRAFILSKWVRRELQCPIGALMLPYMVQHASEIMIFGAKKYAPYNWEKGILFTRIASAGLRHALEYGADDPDSGMPHEWHLDCNVLFAATFEARGELYREFDDRPEGPVLP